MRPILFSGSLTVIGFVFIFGMVAGLSIATDAATLQVRNAASTEGSIVLAQTPDMERRGERRAIRQDCRQQAGLVGAAKRHCKQTLRGQWSLGLWRRTCLSRQDAQSQPASAQNKAPVQAPPEPGQV
jgi:hypothetical protein